MVFDNGVVAVKVGAGGGGVVEDFVGFGADGVEVDSFAGDFAPESGVGVARGGVAVGGVGGLDETESFGLGVDLFTGESGFESGLGAGGTAGENCGDGDGDHGKNADGERDFD